MGRASISYTNKDYESLRRELLARVPQLTERWTDFNASDLGVVLLELFCGVGDMLAYYLDAQAAEAFLPTARQRQNVINLCKLIGYRLDGPVAATTTLRFSLAAPLAKDLLIPMGTVCRALLDDGHADFETGLAMLPSTETLLINQTQWSGSKNINPHALFEKPRARIEISPNTGRRGFTDVHVRGMHFTPNAANVSVQCDGELVLSGLTADSSGALTAMFTIPADVRDGTRIVLMTDGVYEAKVGMEINAP
jgi:hypothetical protein